MNQTAKRAIFGAAIGFLASFPATAAEDGAKLAASVKESITAQPSDLLKIVERNVSAHSANACEVVKAAIEASQANAETVASIVQTASTAAPDQMRLIAQCSLAAAPDAVSNVQAVLAKLDPGTGGGSYSAKEAGNYLWAKNVRLGSATPTNSADHYKVVDTNGVHLGDLHARAGIDTRVRATATGGGSTWVYTPRVPVPGEGWIKVEGGILTIRHADNLDFFLQGSDDEWNPLDFPGANVLKPFGTTLPPGPGSGFPPVLEAPPSATQTTFSNPT